MKSCNCLIYCDIDCNRFKLCIPAMIECLSFTTCLGSIIKIIARWSTAFEASVVM